LLTAGTGKIGIRVSAHPGARALAGVARVPISGTSANISCKPACNSIEEIITSFEDKPNIVLDGGKQKVSFGTTVIDSDVNPPYYPAWDYI